MTVLQKISLLLFCVCFISGCYEDEAEITLNSDGSGTLKQKLVISERLIVSTSNGGGSENTPPVSKEKVLEQIGTAVDVTSITQTELPDGGRIIEFEGTFSSAERFFLSEFCSDTLKLRLAPTGDGKAAIYCDIWRTSGDASGPSTTQLYGMAKGLYIKRTVHLPAEIIQTNGYSDKDKNTVIWVSDLRNKEGLAKTKVFIEGPHEGNGFAIFNASRLKFTLPLKAAYLPEEVVEKEKAQKESGGLAAKVAWVSVKKKMTTEGASVAETSDLEIGIEVRWNEDHCPVRCEKPVLVNLLDDLNKDLVSDKGPRVHQGQIFTREKRNKKKELTLRAKTPVENAKKLKQLEGYVEVITDVIKETVVLENIQELAGKESTGSPVLDKLNFRIKSVRGSTLKIEIDGGHQKITSLDMFKEDGSKVKKSGGMGWGNEYSYDFDEDISELNKCQIEVIVSHNIVKVPFSLEEISLP